MPEPSRRYPRVIAILGGIGALFALFFGYTLRNVFVDPSFGSLVMTSFAAILWLAVVVLQPMIITSRSMLGMFALLQAIMVWIPIEQRFTLQAAIGGALLTVFLWMSFVAGRRLVENSVKIKFFRIAPRIESFAMTGIAIFITLTLMTVLSAGQFTSSKDTFSTFFKTFDGIIVKLAPGFSSEGSFHDALRAIFESRFGEESEQAIADSIDSLADSIHKNFGFIVGPGDKFLDVLYKITIGKFITLPPTFKAVAFVAIGVIIFGFVKSIAFFLNWLIVGVAFMVFKVLVGMDAIHIHRESVDQEIIVIN
ncbi:MAG: hypothetical protein AAB407_03620 [Patescibacteria group bacterium]